MTTLILWDIDGTLLHAGGIGAEVFYKALDTTLGIRPTLRLQMSGKTDPQIVAEYLAALEVADAHLHVDPILDELERELALAKERIKEQGRVMPGVVALIDALEARGDVVQSVLTGNIAPNAVVKLAAFGLERRLELEIGAYGSDSADRNELVPIALERARKAHGGEIRPERVWVIGDSPNDFACARAGGVHCLLVATGQHDLGALAELKPDAAVPDLTATESLAELLTS